MSRHLITPSGDRIDLADPRSVATLARLVVDLGGQLDQVRGADVERLKHENSRLREQFDEARERAKNFYNQAAYHGAKSEQRWQTVRDLRAQLREQGKRVEHLEAALAECGVSANRVGPKIGRPVTRPRTAPLSDVQVLRVFLSDLRGRLIAEANRNPSEAVKTGLRLAAREVQNFSHDLPSQVGAA